MSPVTIALYAIWAISGLATVILVLMHSGKGTDLSDQVAGSIYSSSIGTGVAEKNLDRLTVFFIVMFIICMLLCMLFFPQGTLSLGAFTN